MQGSEGVEKVLKIDRPVGRRVLKFDGPSGRGLWMAASRQFLGPLLWKKVAPQATEDRDVSSLLIFGVPQGFAQFRPEEGACVTGFTFMSPVPARRRAKAKNDQLGCGKSDVYRLSSIFYHLSPFPMSYFFRSNIRSSSVRIRPSFFASSRNPRMSWQQRRR